MSKNFSLNFLRIKEAIAFTSCKLSFTSFNNLVVSLQIDGKVYLIFTSINNIKIKILREKFYRIKFVNKWPSLFFGTKSSNDIDQFISKSTTSYKEVTYKEKKKIFFKNLNYDNHLKSFFKKSVIKEMKIDVQLKSKNQINRLTKLLEDLNLKEESKKVKLLSDFEPPRKEAQAKSFQ